MPTKKNFAILVRDRIDPNAWRVEMIDNDGGVEIAIFAGPDAKSRAVRYGDKEYDGNYTFD